jgi:tetratricopeptide (TPR) repeat protein
MKKETVTKYLFFICSALLLVFMLFQSRDAGISCDEILHYQHSIDVYNYFDTHGQDQSALNTPVTHLKYYGQSYDNLVTFLTKWFGIDDIYGFRNLMSSLAGWLTIFVTALFAVWLSGYSPGIFVLILFAVSPTFLGHSQNNLKDIPFALGYISSLFFMFRILFSNNKILIRDVLLLIISIAFALSIRAGGLLLICYLFLFWLIYLFYQYFTDGKSALNVSGRKLFILILISGAAFFMSILLWPFALQDPFRNVLESYRVMAHFPSTFRQIFEGKNEWSDFMPWYYLPKSMLITIPLTVLSGLIFSYTLFKRGKYLIFSLLFFAFLFPLVFALVEKSNLYSSWRQFLFLYPVIVLLSSIALYSFIDSFKNRFIKWGIMLVMVLMSIHPVSFMIRNHPYEYLYYNQTAGGLMGAYGNYETDYYYVSQTEAAEWLIDHLKEKGIDTAEVGATYPVAWLFRKQPGIRTFYLRNEERSLYDWDYAIVANRYIPPFELKNNSWPPSNSIHIIYADDVPVCVILERKTKSDYLGYRALVDSNNSQAISYFREALKVDDNDEMIFYNFALALYNSGDYIQADSVLKKGLELNPDFEPILMYLGNIAKSQGRNEDAVGFYERLISANRKYFKAYVEVSGIYAEKDRGKARQLLRSCLTLNPNYKPAIVALADTYRKSDPDIAKKYDELAVKIK